MATSDALDALAGTALTEGTYRIDDWADMLLRDNLDVAESGDGAVHPLWGYIATQCGIGVGVGELLEMAGSSAADGPMLASVDMVTHVEPRIGVEYRVTGEIVGLVHKEGRKTGPFDLLTFVERLHDADGTVVVECTNVFVLPRRSADAA
jgi:hypothetical protein